MGLHSMLSPVRWESNTRIGPGPLGLRLHFADVVVCWCFPKQNRTCPAPRGGSVVRADDHFYARIALGPLGSLHSAKWLPVSLILATGRGPSPQRRGSARGGSRFPDDHFYARIALGPSGPFTLRSGCLSLNLATGRGPSPQRRGSARGGSRFPAGSSLCEVLRALCSWAQKIT